MRTVVIQQALLLGRPCGLRIGWQITCQNGETYNLWWGNTRDEASLAESKAEIEREYGPCRFVDLREAEPQEEG